MRKITEERIGDFRGVVQLLSLGYVFKIYYRNKMIDQSYVYFKSKEVCIDKMKDCLKMHAMMTKDLFDLEKI